MSTNFYIADAEGKISAHIGKRSAGWVFMFEGREQRTVQDWRDTIAYLGRGEHVVDEYGASYTPDEFWEAVEATKSFNSKPSRISDDQGHRPFWISEGFTFHNYEFC